MRRCLQLPASAPAPPQMLIRRATATVCVIAAALAVALTPSAGANSRQQSIVQDDSLVLNHGAGTRDSTLDEFRMLGAEIVKVQLRWSEVAPASKPPGFDPRSPT